MQIASSGEQALKIVELAIPDLIVLDVLMPEMDGHEVCRRLKMNPKSSAVPVLFLSSKVKDDDVCVGFELGASDYLNKPINPQIFVARVKAQLRLKAAADQRHSRQRELLSELQAGSQELQISQDLTIQALTTLAAIRYDETGNHLRRTQHYVRSLAKQLCVHPRFSKELTDQNIELLFKSAPLHDIGKVGINDRILRKSGRFEPSEFELMKRHARLGYEVLEHSEKILGVPMPFLRIAKEIALCHHEKWDGSGYPYGLMGDEIPISARLMAVADVYDAIISRRVYKSAMCHSTAARIINEGAGRHFDPDVVIAFLALETEFQNIALRFTDATEKKSVLPPLI
jgi:putative two-component system response regulator